MKQTILICPRDPLIFRDGKPFDVGVHTASSLDFPLPSTLAGMCRTSLGLAKAPDFFERRHPDHEQRIQQVMAIGLNQLSLVYLGESLAPLFPAPADAIAKETSGNLLISPLRFQPLAEGEQTDWQRPGWLFPFSGEESKPYPLPRFWNWNLYRQWLVRNDPLEITENEIGLKSIATEQRMHVTIDFNTGTAEEGNLFQVRQLRFTDKSCNRLNELGIVLELTGVPDGWKTPPFGILGGDRRVAGLETLKESRFPACPEEIGTQGNLLQLILITPGAFTGGWCPTWLDQSDNHGWVIIPETALKIRLRSAVVDRWQPVSGWNLKLKGERNQGSPKHFRKAVGSGSIYLVETEPGKSAQIAQQLWGKSLCEEIQDRRDGFGICLVGNVNETNSLAKGEHP